MKMEASYMGKEVAALVRAHQSGQIVDGMAVWEAFENLAVSDATNAEDALALVAMANLLMRELSSAETYRDFAFYCTRWLMEKAQQALETEVGAKGSDFTGREPDTH